MIFYKIRLHRFATIQRAFLNFIDLLLNYLNNKVYTYKKKSTHLKVTYLPKRYYWIWETFYLTPAFWGIFVVAPAVPLSPLISDTCR